MTNLIPLKSATEEIIDREPAGAQLDCWVAEAIGLSLWRDGIDPPTSERSEFVLRRDGRIFRNFPPSDSSELYRPSSDPQYVCDLLSWLTKNDGPHVKISYIPHEYTVDLCHGNTLPHAIARAVAKAGLRKIREK